MHGASLEIGFLLQQWTAGYSTSMLAVHSKANILEALQQSFTNVPGLSSGDLHDIAWDEAFFCSTLARPDGMIMNGVPGDLVQEAQAGAAEDVGTGASAAVGL